MEEEEEEEEAENEDGGLSRGKQESAHSHHELLSIQLVHPLFVHLRILLRICNLPKVGIVMIGRLQSRVQEGQAFGINKRQVQVD